MYYELCPPLTLIDNIDILYIIVNDEIYFHHIIMMGGTGWNILILEMEDDMNCKMLLYNV